MKDVGSDYNGATSDVYTALTVIATLFVLTGVVILAVQSQTLFGSWLPLGGP